MTEISGRLGLYGAEHSKCNSMMTLGSEGLKTVVWKDRRGPQIKEVAQLWQRDRATRPDFRGWV